jgi:sugar lactone lactonase YvrE
VIFSGCAQTPAGPTATATSGPRAIETPLQACPLAPAPNGPQVLASSLQGPDDLAFDNSGRLLFSDVSAGTVSVLDADGSIQRIAGGLRSPEGIVVQADGRILVAEQGRNRIVSLEPESGAVIPWRTFVNRSASEGIDGIGPLLPATDATGQPLADASDVIVPDSPNGVVWKVTPDGKTATVMATGMTRPVGAARDAQGRILVADEGGALWILESSPRRFATLSTPDDVVVAHDGEIFVNTLGDNAIHTFDSSGHAVRVQTGIVQPQGIALDGADNLYYTEGTAGRIDRIVRTFVLGSPSVRAIDKNTFILCPAISRAAGFKTALELSSGSSLNTSIRQIIQPGAGSSGALEVQTTEHSVSIEVHAANGNGNPGLSQIVKLP